MPATTELLQEGRYRIDHSPNATGEERTFEAYDTVRHINVIVREIPIKLNKVATVSQRESLKIAFATQAKALTEIKHDSLLHVHDFFSEIDRQYIVMEAIEGDSLADQIRRSNKPFPVDEVTSWADQLLDALNYLHSRKPAIIHRNIHPDNVKVDPAGKIKLVGVAVESGADVEFEAGQVDSEKLRYSPLEQIWPGLDPASQKVITNSYDDRSERILKQPLDERSDIYSLGATLYFLMTGVEPVDPLERSIEILEGKLDPLPEPSKVDSRIPADISDVLMKALEIKRENRFDSAMIMRQVLQTAISRVSERSQGDAQSQSSATEENRRAEQAKLAAIENEKRLQAEAEERRREVEAAALRLKQETEAEEKRRQAQAEEQKMREAKAEEQRQRELMEQQLRAAEEMRIKEEKAAEEARKRKEAEAAEAAREAARAAEAAAAQKTQMDVPADAEVVAYRENPPEVDEDDLAAVLRELEEVEAESQPTASDVTVLSDQPIDLAPQASTTESSSADDDMDDIFSMPEKSGFSLSMPMIAGMAVLVIVIGIGGWFAMSGSSNEQKASVPPVQVEQQQPAVVQPTPATEVIATSTEPQPETATSTQPVEDRSTEQTKIAAAKPKKADAKAEPAKKKVTVDDLINDN